MPFSPWMKHILLTDLFLMKRVFMPLAWWIDWRFHRSPYQVAVGLMNLAQVLNLTGTALMLSRNLFPGMLMLGVSLLLHFTVFNDYRKRLAKCQAQFEKRPDLICFDQLMFMSPHMVIVRVPTLIFGAVIFGTLLAIDLATDGRPTGALANCWLPISAVGLYFAGCLPPQRPRRSKKERAWGAATLPTPA